MGLFGVRQLGILVYEVIKYIVNKVTFESEVLNFILFVHCTYPSSLEKKFQFQGLNCNSGNKVFSKIGRHLGRLWKNIPFPKFTSLCHAIICCLYET